MRDQARGHQQQKQLKKKRGRILESSTKIGGKGGVGCSFQMTAKCFVPYAGKLQNLQNNSEK